jgi:hypothetical protein
MMNVVAAGRNLGAKISRRVLGLHKPIVRHARRASRLRDQAADLGVELRVLRSISQVASGREPIVLGPWLSEVGYEILYWIPFLRWFKDRYCLDEDRLIVLTRGGAASWYSDITPRHAEILELMDPGVFAARNSARRSADESGGQKQTAMGELDEELLRLISERLGLGHVKVCHPSLMYGLFRQFWFANRALDLVTSHTRFARARATAIADLSMLPRRFAAVKFYTGAAIPDTADTRGMLYEIVVRLARELPVVLLDTGLALDEHDDYTFGGIANVTSLRGLLTPQNNLAVQAQVIASASGYVGTCGSLAWLAPLLGVPTVAAYADDRFLVSHLYVARHAYRHAEAADFHPLDLRGVSQLGALVERTVA